MVEVPHKYQVKSSSWRVWMNDSRCVSSHETTSGEKLQIAVQDRWDWRMRCGSNSRPPVKISCLHTHSLPVTQPVKHYLIFKDVCQVWPRMFQPTQKKNPSCVLPDGIQDKKQRGFTLDAFTSLVLLSAAWNWYCWRLFCQKYAEGQSKYVLSLSLDSSIWYRFLQKFHGLT